MKPINLELHNPDTGEVEKTLTITFIPWKYTKELIAAQKKVNAKGDHAKSLDEIEDMVIRAFNGRLTKKDIAERVTWEMSRGI